jgi:hypothetical protein
MSGIHISGAPTSPYYTLCAPKSDYHNGYTEVFLLSSEFERVPVVFEIREGQKLVGNGKRAVGKTGSAGLKHWK